MADLTDRSTDVSIHNPTDNTKAVATITDGAIERLAVDAKVSVAVPSASNISNLVKLGYVYCWAGRVNMASAGVNNPIFLMKNPSGSSKVLYIYKMHFGVDVENNYANFRLYASPTITTNGTLQTVYNRNIGGGFGASAMQAYTLPTVSANGNEIMNVEVGQNNNSIETLSDFGIHIQANNNIMITGDPKSNSRNAVLTIVWAEY
jgi:hypothetical protein